jgi:hypothetical protein
MAGGARGAVLCEGIEKSFYSQLQNGRCSKASVRAHFDSVFWAEGHIGAAT